MFSHASAKRAFLKFRRCRRGNIAMLTALLLVPVVGLGGLAVDHAIVSMHHSRLSTVADSTALLGARRAKSLIEFGQTGIDARLGYLKGQLTKHFTAETADMNEVNHSIRLERQGTDVKVVVDWNVELPSVFGKIVGTNSYPIAGRSGSTVSLKPYLQLYVLVDVSQSMGIGATVSDQQRLFDRESCMFACHLPASMTSSKVFPGRTTYEAARLANPPINTRVDVARDGVIKIIDFAEQEAGGSEDRIKVGVYAFSNGLKEIAAIDAKGKADFKAIRKVVGEKLILGQDQGGSNLMAAMAELEGKITRVGDGSTVDNPKVAVIVLTDGIANSTLIRTDPLRFSAQQPFHALATNELGSIQNPRSSDFEPAPNASQIMVDGVTQIDAGRIGAVDDRSCGLLKDRGVAVMMIETPYVIPPKAYRGASSGKEDLRFAWLETRGRLDSVSSRLRSCATSPAYFSMAGDNIEEALSKMGELAFKNFLRLTN